MFSFLKNDTKQPTVPDWASFFDRYSYNIFISFVENYFKKKKVKFEFEDGLVHINEDFHGLEKLGLINVAQQCNQSEPNDWEEVISNHFNTLIQANAFEKEFNQNIENFDYVKPFIAVRLYHYSFFEEVGREHIIGRKLTEDIFMTLVFDMPYSVTNIQPEQAEKWNLPISQLFELGINNIKLNYPVEISEVEFEGFSAFFVNSDSFFTPNLILDLESYPQLIGSHGSLLCIPNRHYVLIYPIENLEVVKAINKLIPVTYSINLEGPGSLSDKLYWYKDGKLENQPYNLSDEKLQFTPSNKFSEVLNNLKEA